MNRIIQLIAVVIIPLIAIFYVINWYHIKVNGFTPATQIELAEKSDPSDHTKYESLQKEFDSPQDVTKACLDCHNKRGKQLLTSVHWRWEQTDTLTDGRVVSLGKKNILNNFCIGIGGNEKLCQTCHVGFGWGDKDFDFDNPENIDCLVCHDNSGTYKKQKGKAGMPAPNVDLNVVAQHVGHPQNANCGSCHFKGGGGNNVKHGDLEVALLSCTKDVDVHMNTDINMACTECHDTKEHNVPGNLYSVAANDNNRVTCEQCHTAEPHQNKCLNRHYKRVSCQTCHIPTYAKVAPTKLWWDWSTAGKLKNGKPYEEDSEDKLHHYDSKHGDAVSGKNLIPEYAWFNGNVGHVLLGDKIDGDTVNLNPLVGGANIPESKIYPVKVMRGKQIFDTENLTLIQPKLFGPKGSGAYWSDFDWDASAEKGMAYIDQPYSGHYGFINTESNWLLNHMVSPAEDALSCTDCHSKDGRLQNFDGLYIAGHNTYTALDWIGLLFVISTILGVSIHGTFRVLAKKNNKNN